MWGTSICEIYPVLVPIHIEVVAGGAELCTVVLIAAVPWPDSQQLVRQSPESLDRHFVLLSVIFSLLSVMLMSALIQV